MKRILLFLILLFAAGAIQAQTVMWAKKGSSEGFDNGNAIAVDDSGNTYVTGQFEFNAIFDNYVLSAYGQHDIFTAKYSPDGNIKWIKKAGGAGGDIGNGIGIDAQHNVYITGEIEDTANFGLGVKVISQGSNDGFIAKYDANGNIVWAWGFGSAASDKGRALAVSPSGNCYLTGNFTNTTDFKGISLSTAGGNDIFVVKVDALGNSIWAKKAGGGYQDRGYGITVDKNENVFVTGTFTQSANFSSITLTNNGQGSAFLAKYNSNGQIQWAKDEGACCDTTKPNSISLDADGNIYLAGSFADKTKIGPNNFTSLGFTDIFVTKYNPSGQVLWAKQAGGIDEDIAYGIIVDTLNQLVYTTGLVRETGYFDNIPFSIAGYKDIFVTAYDLNGNVKWVRTYGGHLRDLGSAIAVDRFGYIYSTGLFNDIAAFESITLTGYPNQPWADFYINKISPPVAELPTLSSIDVILTTAQCSDLVMNLTPGNGQRRIIIARKDFSVNASPVNGMIYNANSAFGIGSDLGSGNFVVYNGNGSSANITGLTPGSFYYFAVYEYNGYGITSNYSSNASTSSAFSPVYPISVNLTQNAICSGSSVTVSAAGAGMYAWTPSSSLSSSTGDSVLASPITTTTYTITGTTLAGCYAETNFTVTVNPLPVVTCSAQNAICLNNSPVALSGGNPAGGIYSGQGITGNMFDPQVTGSGNYAINYLYTDANGCSANASSSIHVRSIPGVIMTTLPTLCDNSSEVTLVAGSPLGGTYSGNGVTNGKFNPNVGAGSYAINYSYTDAFGCTGNTTGYLVVKASPNVNLGNDLHACATDHVTLNAGAGFSSYLWSNGAHTATTTYDSSGTGLGSKYVNVQVTNSNGCSDSDTLKITFDLCAGIDEAYNFPQAGIYPNPFSGQFTLITDRVVSYNIYDARGKLLEKNHNISGSIVTGENLSPGVYFVEIYNSVSKKVIPIVKQQ